ncbi:ABC transporter substrate-binding protein [Halogeometricum borinquense]|uniref:ABC transporter substrate-binding protein n=1 Tax=Halogeometricum borinquense TaxID=60847 RepID=A0A6C0UE64_9EURY|nr:ABC transporter substrate-binding protein [Halogeometricum borinquense]QIB73655.1 ABC transporter substrate-binding protein [Halogeometricum borinquense]QIQ76989.1 ABC transporter substrate-binding protein [Halogeometricum borinquense]
MRVVSLLPSATELLYGLGAEPLGVSHSCDYPPAARAKPVLTSTVIEYGDDRSPADIDRQTRNVEGSTYDIDVDLLADLDPDLVVTQATCEVCAVDASDVFEAVERRGIDADVLTLDPHSLSDVLDDLTRVGEAIGASDTAASLRAELEARIERVTDRAAAAMARPRTAVLDWTDPVIAGGHWVPDMVERAGGTPGLVTDGPSTPQYWDDVRAFDPEVLIVAPCGFDVERGTDAVSDLRSTDGWANLTAVQNGNVYVVDGNGYVNRPGPRLVDSLELFASCIHPDRFEAPAPDVVRRVGAVPP